MWYVLYNVLLLIASPVILLILLAKKRCRPGLAQRLGLFSLSGLFSLPGPNGQNGPDRPNRLDRPDEPVIWVHAVSLGEVVAVTPLVKQLKQRFPQSRLIVSTVTETGREAVAERLAGVAEHCYAPLDFPWVVETFVRALKPRAFLFVETELWPNLLGAMNRRGIPAILVNGRLSTSSFRGYRLLKPLFSRVLKTVSLFLMQSDRDAERIIALGAPPSRVIRTGNIKFDQSLPSEGATSGGIGREFLGLAEREDLIVAGSTHPVEEEQLLSCYRKLHAEFSSLVLLIAPRHIERAAEVEAVVKAQGMAVQRRSAPSRSLPPGGGGPEWGLGRGRVLILDTRGELASVYRHAVIAFVGGTLVPVGGHSLIEPALWGKPVFYGPHTDHCAEIAALLTEAGGGVQVGNAEELATRMAAILRNREQLKSMGEAASTVIAANRGAVAHSLAEIERLIKQRPFNPATLDRARPTWMQRLLMPLSIPYGLVVRMRAALYRHGWLAQRRLPCRVISVGNLTVGGTGKTPVVIALVERLLAAGQRVGVLSRGYRRRSRDEMLLVSDGRTMLVGPSDAGDEPSLIARRCPRAVVAVGADRYRVGQWVLSKFPLDCLVLDDGFQHLALQRDVDLLVIDGSDVQGIQALLPAGRLREPLAAAARATAVLVTRADGGDVESLVAQLNQATGKKQEPIVSRFTVEHFVNLVMNQTEPAEHFAGKAAVLFSGIGNPASFRRLIERMGIPVLDEVVFGDHHDYHPADLDQVRELVQRHRAAVTITTEKDAAKIVSLLKDGEQVWAARLRLDLLQGRERWDRLIMGNLSPVSELVEAHA